LFLSESLAKAVGPSIAGSVVALLGAVLAVASNAGSFLVSVSAVVMIRAGEPGPAAVAAPRRRGWVIRDVRDGLRFVFAHPELEPVILCGTVYMLFLTMINASLVVYCGQRLGLGPAGVGLVIGAAAAGLPIGNILSSPVIARVGVARALALGAAVSVLGIVAMPVAGSLGSAIGLVFGSVVHGVGEGVFGPTSLTLRQTASPSQLLSRVQSIQRFLIWGCIPIGSLLAAAAIALAGLDAAVWIGGVGTVFCLPVLLRRGIRAAAFGPQRKVTDHVLAGSVLPARAR
jgi:MFS family permease